MLKILERSITLQLLVLYGAFLLPLLLGGIELYSFERDSLQQSIQRADVGLVQAIAFTVEGNVQTVSEDEAYLASTPAARQLDLHQLTPMLIQASHSYPDRSYIICDPSGRVVLTYPLNQKVVGQNFSKRNYFQSALASDKPVVTSPEQSSSTSFSSVITLATRITDNNHLVGVIITNLSLDQLTAQLITIQRQFTANNAVSIWLVDKNGQSFAGTNSVFETPPNVKQSLQEFSGSLIAHQQNRDWSYSFISVKGTDWKVVVGRPVDVILAPVISFQHSLIIALLMLVVGASLFWIAMHGWVVAPLSRLAQAVRMITPDRTIKVTESKLVAKERHRVDEIGQLIAAFSTMEDEIHDLFRKSDETSQARLHTLDAIMQSMRDGVLLESPQGHIIYANRSFTQFIGISAQEMHLTTGNDDYVAQKLLALVQDPTAYREALYQIEQSDGLQMATFQTHGYYNQVGQLVPVRRDVHMQHFEVRDGEGQLIGRGKIFNDVTRQNEAEQIKKNLLAIVSHELRTPLTAIKGYATSLLETDVEVDITVQQRFLQRIVEEGDRMADLVTNLLEMSQLEAGTLKLSPAFYPLDALLKQVISADEQDHIHMDMSTELPLLYVDRRRIEMVLRNVIENAKRYAGPGAVIAITARYQQHASEQADAGLYLSVTDNGPGLPAQLTERIFDRFYQIDGGRERSGGGVGLGLAICRGFIEAHGGRIWAENRTDGITGAVFHIWLPAKVLRTIDAQSNLFELHNAL